MLHIPAVRYTLIACLEPFNPRLNANKGALHHHVYALQNQGAPVLQHTENLALMHMW